MPRMLVWCLINSFQKFGMLQMFDANSKIQYV